MSRDAGETRRDRKRGVESRVGSGNLARVGIGTGNGTGNGTGPKWVSGHWAVGIGKYGS